jgi:hypothetical protein
MQGMSNAEVAQYVRDIFSGHVLVFGTFPDPAELAGVGALLIKGHAAALAMRDTGKLPNPFTATAIPFRTREQTMAAWAAWGDGKR